MADEKKDKEIKVKTTEKEGKPMEDQKITTESPADVAPTTNNSGIFRFFCPCTISSEG